MIPCVRVYVLNILLNKEERRGKRGREERREEERKMREKMRERKRKEERHSTNNNFTICFSTFKAVPLFLFPINVGHWFQKSLF